MKTGEAQRRAVAKALTPRARVGFRRVTLGTYRVESDSRPGTWHTVRVTPDGRHSCDCEAGLAHRPCLHAALTYVLRLEKNSGVRVTAPAASPVATPAPAAADAADIGSRRAA